MEISNRIIELEKDLKVVLDRNREALKEEKTNILSEIKKEYDELKNEAIDEELIKKKKKQNDIEVKIGLNLINKIGIILLLLGVATAMKYTYSTWFNDYVKSISGFLLGIIFLGMGEWLSKKEKNIFSLGMCGGGIGILYLSLFSSYFMLNTIRLTTGLTLSLLITAISIILSKRHNSQTITSISLIGGYLPFFSYTLVEGLSGSSIYIAMIYLVVFNLTVLILSLDNRWTFVKYLSFILNIPTSLYLVFIADNKVISLTYLLVVLVIYALITLAKPIKERLDFKKSEIILLGFNTFINCCATYALFDILKWDDFYGFLALTYAIGYYVLGRFVKNTNKKKASDLFYLTSLTFSVLMIPFQFGVEWVSMGWLIESVLLLHIVRTRHKEDKVLENSGWAILALCVLSFTVVDFDYLYSRHFIFKYTLITLSLLYVLKLYLPILNKDATFKYTKKGIFLSLYKYFSIVFAWVFLLRVSYIGYDKFIKDYYYANFFKPVIFAMITAIYAYICSNMNILKDKVVSIMTIVMYVLVDLTCLGLTTSGITHYFDKNIRVLSVIILVAYNVFVFFNIKYLILKLINKTKITIETYPLVMAIYLLGSVSSFLVSQFDLSNTNLIISIVFIVLSFVYIIYGFKFRYVLIRRFGLGLSIFSTAKLFIFDLSYLNTVGRIVAYLAFGFTLIAISFVYQRLRIKEEI